MCLFNHYIILVQIFQNCQSQSCWVTENTAYIQLVPVGITSYYYRIPLSKHVHVIVSDQFTLLVKMTLFLIVSHLKYNKTFTNRALLVNIFRISSVHNIVNIKV